MNDSTTRRRLALTGATALLAFATAAAANAQNNTTPGADDEGLAEIVVTARKTSERLIDVPLAITAFSSEAIEQKGITSLDDIAAATPGLTFSDVQAGFLPTPVIRGFAPIDVRGENNAGIFIDGVYVAGREGLNFAQLDLDRIEVVKGPQASLYGRNAFSGALNYVTTKPTDTFKGKAEAQFGTRGKQVLSGMLSGPLIEGVLKGRIAASYDNFNGSYRNQFTGGTTGRNSKIGGYEYKTAIASLSWTPTDNFDAYLWAYHSQDIVGNAAISPVQANCENTNSLLRLATATTPVGYLNYCGTFQPVGRNGLSAIPAATGNDRRVSRVHLNLNWETSFGTLTSLTGYSKLEQTFNVDGSRNVGENVPFVYIGVPVGGLVTVAGAFQAGVQKTFRTGLLQIGGGSNTEEISTELRFASKKENPFRWGAGFTYYQTKADGGSDGVVSTKPLPSDFFAFCVSCRSAALFGGPANLTLDPAFVPPDGSGFLPWFTNPTGDAVFATTNTQKVSAPSGFLSAEYDFAQGLTGRVEGRYTREKKEFGSNLNVPVNSRTGDKSWGLKNYRATLDYKPTPNMTFYGSFGHAEKSGSVSAATVRFTTASTVNVPILTSFDPEQNNEFELGFKTQFADRRMYLDFDVYQSKWKDIVIPFVLTQVVNPATGALADITTPTAFNTNAGDATLRGVEMSLEFKLNSRLSGGLGLSYIDAKYDKAVIASFNSFPSFSPTGDVSGKQLLRVSPLQSSMSLRYTAPLADTTSRWYVGGDVSYRDKQFADAANEAITPSLTKLNMQIGIQGEAWSLELWGRNLTGEDGPTAAYRDVYFSNALPDGTFFRTPGSAATGNVTPAGSTGKSTFFPWRYSVSYPTLREYGITARYKF